MSVASEITRLQTAKAGIKSALEAKGVTVSSAATLDEYPQYVEDIPAGGDEEVVKGLLNGSITALTVPNGTTTIRQYGLFGTALRTLDLNNSVISIQNSGIKSCGNLTGITNASALTNFDMSALYEAKKLISIESLGVLKQIGTEAFKTCTALTNAFTISATTVGHSAFQNCYNVPKYTFLIATKFDAYSDSNNYSHFNNNTACTEWDFSDTINISILNNKYSFNGCTGNIKIPAIMADEWCSGTSPLGFTNKWGQCAISGNVVTVTDKYPTYTVNYNYTGTTRLYPNKQNFTDYTTCGLVKNVFDTTTGGTWTFYGPEFTLPAFVLEFKNLTDVSFGEGLQILASGSCDQMSQLSGVTLPTTLHTLQYKCFWRDYALTSISCSYVKTFGVEVFRECTGLTSINMEGAETIGDNCFYSCSNLTSLTFGAVPPSYSNNTFNGMPNVGVIYCPASSVDAYTTWKASIGYFYNWTVQAISE